MLAPLAFHSDSIVPVPGMVAQWLFDGNATESVNGINGTLNNGATYESDAPYAALTQSLSLDGVNDNVTHSASTIVQVDYPFTLALWVKPANTGAIQLAYSNNNISPYRGIAIYLDGGLKAEVLMGDGSGTGAGDRRNGEIDTALTADVWNHILFAVRDETDIDGYLNGTSETVNYSGTASAFVYDSGQIGRFGNRSDANWPFEGNISDVRLFDRDVTAAEAAQIHAGN